MSHKSRVVRNRTIGAGVILLSLSAMLGLVEIPDFWAAVIFAVACLTLVDTLMMKRARG